jgi:hypothetical protein
MFIGSFKYFSFSFNYILVFLYIVENMEDIIVALMTLSSSSIVLELLHSFVSTDFPSVYESYKQND